MNSPTSNLSTHPTDGFPLCSVIIPCYNQGAYLAEAIASVRASTYPHVDITIVDDGSTDLATVEHIWSAGKAKGIRAVWQPNQGLAGARNTGIRNAAGKYILPLDADDRIHPDFIRQAVHALEANENAGIVSCNVELFGDQTGPYPLPPYHFPSILLRNSFVCTSMFRRTDWERVGGYRRNMIYGFEDWDFWISLVGMGRKVVQLDEAMFYYRKHGRSMISDIRAPEKFAAAVRQIRANHSDLYRKYRVLLLWDRIRYNLFHKSRQRPPRSTP